MCWSLFIPPRIPPRIEDRISLKERFRTAAVNDPGFLRDFLLEVGRGSHFFFLLLGFQDFVEGFLGIPYRFRIAITTNPNSI